MCGTRIRALSGFCYGGKRSITFVVGILVVIGLVGVPEEARAIADAPPNPIIQDMAPNTWYEVPASQLQDVEAEDCDFNGNVSPCFPGIWAGNFRGSRGIFYWGGGAFDSKRNRLILWGGGHNAYYGNELYAFDLTNLAWERITDPDRKSTRLNSSHTDISRMPSSA